MGSVVKASVALAVLVGVLTLVFFLTGLHRNPLIGGLGGIAVAILINIAVVIWALKKTAGENHYGQQLVNGLLIGVIGGLLIFALSWVMLTAVPGYFEGIQEGNIEFIRNSGIPEDQAQAQIERIQASTPVGQAFAGFAGTLVTSFVVGAIAGGFLRRK